MRVLALAALLGLGGCSLLFDGDALLPVDAAVPLDLAVAAPDDLAMPPDDALAPADLTPPCTPGVFAGSFGDGGVFDCPCGCTLDPFTAPPAAARWSMATTAGWTVNAAAGTLQVSRASASNGDYVVLTSAYQLAGDFELRLDYSLVAAPNGGAALAVAYGPSNGTVYVPTFYADVYSTGPMLRGITDVDDNSHNFSGIPMNGTLRLSRANGTSCAEVVGVDQDCRAATSPLMHWYIEVVESNMACVLCGALDMRFANARLVRGRLVP